jgi:hypothetical protein
VVVRRADDRHARGRTKLAAIFAADIAAHSRLMGQDEVGTLARLTGRAGAYRVRAVTLMLPPDCIPTCFSLRVLAHPAVAEESKAGRTPDIERGVAIGIDVRHRYLHELLKVAEKTAVSSFRETSQGYPLDHLRVQISVSQLLAPRMVSTSAVVQAFS